MTTVEPAVDGAEPFFFAVTWPLPGESIAANNPLARQAAIAGRLSGVAGRVARFDRWF
jgi:hypothetical protein